jgi:transcription elongation factor Elf1
METKDPGQGRGQQHSKVWFWTCSHCGDRNASEVSPDVKAGRYSTVVCDQCGVSQIQVASLSKLTPDRRKEPRGKKEK